MKIPSNSVFKQQSDKNIPATFKKAIISSVSVVTNTASVYIVGNTQTIIQNIPFAKSVNVASVRAGDRCRVDCFSESNPSDMVICYTY